MFLIDKAGRKNGRTLESVPDCYKNQQMLIKLLIITLMH